MLVGSNSMCSHVVSNGKRCYSKWLTKFKLYKCAGKLYMYQINAQNVYKMYIITMYVQLILVLCKIKVQNNMSTQTYAHQIEVSKSRCDVVWP